MAGTSMPSGDAPECLDEPRTSPWAWALCLVLVAVPFLPGLRGEFVYDDLAMVARNPRITGLAHLPDVLARPMLDFLDPDSATRIGYWRPVAGLGLMLGYALGGGTPIGFHAVSLGLHLLATAVAFRIGLRLARDGRIAFFTALLFGLHPTRVEGVSWVSAINDPLFGLFSLLALDAFVAWRDGGSRGFAWKTAPWLALALLSKEMAAAVAPMAIAIDLARGRGRETGSARLGSLLPLGRAYGPMLATVLLYLLARAAVFGDALAGFDRVTTDFGVPPLRLLLARVELLGGFLWLLAWPADLNLFRPFRPVIPLDDPELLRALVGILLLVAAVVWAWRGRRARLLLALLLIPAAVSPALIRMESLGMFPLSDRFLYLAGIGWGLLLALAAGAWRHRWAGSAALALVAVAYGTQTWTRTGFWRDERTLFEAAIRQSPRSPYVRWGCARVLLQEYRVNRDIDALRRANEQAVAALDLLAAAQQGDGSIFATRNDHVQSNLGLAWTLLYEAEIDPYHDFDTPLRVFRMVAERYPGDAYGQTGLGIAAMQAGRLDEAQAALERALELNPNYSEAHHNLGILHLRRGNAASAAASFENALRHRPDVLDDLLWLARSRLQQGDRASAIAAIDRAVERHGDASGPLVLRGTLAAQGGDLEEAMKWVGRALDANPDDGEALLLRSKLLLARGEKAGARTSLFRACELLPSSFEAHYNTAALLLEVEGLEAAMPYLIRAYGLRSDDAIGQTLRETLLRSPIDDPDRLARLGAIDLDRGDSKAALEWLDRAISKAPDHGPALFLRGVLLREGGDRGAAEEHFRRACLAMPGSFEARHALGMLLDEQGRAGEALPYLEQAFELARGSNAADPAAASALEQLAELVERVRRDAEAHSLGPVSDPR